MLLVPLRVLLLFDFVHHSDEFSVFAIYATIRSFLDNLLPLASFHSSHGWTSPLHIAIVSTPRDNCRMACARTLNCMGGYISASQKLR